MDNQQENMGWSDASLPDLDSDQYSDFEVIEPSIDDGDVKMEEIPPDESHEDSNAGLKIPKILINSVEPDDEQDGKTEEISHEDSNGLKIPKILINSIEPDDEQDGEEMDNLDTANGLTPDSGSDRGDELVIEESGQQKKVFFYFYKLYTS